MLVLGATVFFETRALERRGHLAAVQLAVLAEAASAHAHSLFPALLAQAQGGPSELTVAGLKAAGALPAEFSETGALGRGYRVLMLAAGSDAFDLLVTETVRPGDTVRPAAASAGGHRAAHRPRRPVPALGSHGGRRPGAPSAPPSRARRAEGALAALRRFDHGGVFGDALYRVAIPGFADANRMEADLDMGGNAIEGAGTVEAARLEVATDVEAGGDLTVTGDLVVGRALQVGGTVEATDRIAAGAARIQGAVTSRFDECGGRGARADGGGGGPGRGGLDRRRGRGRRRQRAAGRVWMRHR